MRRLIFLLAFTICTLPLMAQTTVEIVKEHRSVSPAINEWKFTVPPFGVEHQVRLSLETRVDWPTLAGSNPWLRAAVNGTFLTQPDLLNKRDEFKLRSGLDITWSKGDRWRVLYSPDFEAALKPDSPMSAPDVEPYRYVWDITRHVRPGENTLQIHNLPVLDKPTTMVLRNIQIETGRPISPPAQDEVEPAPTGPLPTFIARGAQKVPMKVLLSGGGFINISVAGQNFYTATRTSLPDEKWSEGQDTPLTTAIPTGQAKTISWQTAHYKVARKVSVRDDHVHVADTFTNTTKELIGIIVENRLKFANKPERAYTAGWLAPGEWYAQRNPYHPSVFAQWKDVGVGLVAEDDIYRIHIKSFREPDNIGLADDQLGLAPGASHTLEWSIYPVPKTNDDTGDYWDFVNVVRRNWDTNFAIPGPFVFTMHMDAKKSPAELGEWMRKRDVKIGAGGIAKFKDGKYAHGTGILYAPEWVAYEKEWMRKVHSVAPDIKLLCYFHAQISNDPDGETKFAADRMFDAKGEPLHYPYRYAMPMFLPRRNSVYGKALWGYVNTILDTIEADGLYWDEMSHSILEFTNRAPEWDNCTVMIDDKTHAVTGKRSSVQLLMQPLQLDIIRHLQKRKKYLMANTQAMTRTMLREKIVRFVETGSYSAVINTHLGCPLGLGNHHEEDTHADAARHVRRILEQGGVYYAHIYNREPAPWNFMSVMYPITPSRIGPGFVIGQERIHTTVSGRFGFPDGAAEVYVVDANGARVAQPNVKEIVENGKRQYEVRMPSDHFAVLVKR